MLYNLKSFNDYLISINENVNSKTTKKKITIKINIDWNNNIKSIKENITLAISESSIGLFDLGKNIEKYTGLTKKEAKTYAESEDDAYVFGMCNVMNDGNDIFFWTNGTRLSGQIKGSKILPEILQYLSHECIHLTRLILSKHILNKKKVKNWVNSKEWPSIGDNRIVDLIDEESFSTAVEEVVRQLTVHFIKMMIPYTPEAKFLLKNI